MISNSAETSRIVHFGREEAMTYEERWNASLQVKFIAYAVGAPSLLSTAFCGIVGLWYAWIFTSDIQTWLAVSAGLLAITFFSAGLPIAWASTRGHNNVVARASFALWLACVAMNFVTMSHFARHVPAPAGPGYAVARDMAEDEAYDLDIDIESVRNAIAEGVELTKTRGGSPYYQRRRQELQAELLRLETKRYGAPVTMAAPARPGSAPGLDLAAIALIMIAGSAVGLLISAGSLAAIMTSRVREMQGQAANAEPVAEAVPAGQAPRFHSSESFDGFNLWIGKCLSRVRNGSVRPAAALAHYVAFCAANNVRARLDPANFYTRFSQYLGAVHGIASAHSNGPVYRGVALFDDEETAAMLAPGEA